MKKAFQIDKFDHANIQDMYILFYIILYNETIQQRIACTSNKGTTKYNLFFFKFTFFFLERKTKKKVLRISL